MVREHIDERYVREYRSAEKVIEGAGAELKRLIQIYLMRRTKIKKTAHVLFFSDLRSRPRLRGGIAAL